MANPEFIGLVTSVQATAEAALGDLNAATSSAARDGLLEGSRAQQVAQRSLGLLLMLAEKTRGNLDFDEADILTDAITSLRSRMDTAPQGLTELGMADTDLEPGGPLEPN